jgi:chemotaxis response regulator CheB
MKEKSLILKMLKISQISKPRYKLKLKVKEVKERVKEKVKEKKKKRYQKLRKNYQLKKR